MPFGGNNLVLFFYKLFHPDPIDLQKVDARG